ncbi:MAG: hypothetical protein K2M46_02915 [Lachnospiraceae bacterium]|nr:hypothetical protein [Lachnospiraceae bacterium]
MEARREKLMQARASFGNQGSPSLYRSPEKTTKVSQDLTEKKIQHISLIIRLLIAASLFLLYIYAMEYDVSEMNEIAQKSCEEIKKNEIIIEKCSAELGKIW